MRKVTLTLFILALLAPAAGAQDRASERQALVGLRGAVVLVSIDDSAPRLTRHADKAQLEAFTEGELRRGGLLTGEKKHLLRDPPVLIVMIEAERCGNVLVTRVAASLLDNVTTARDPDKPFRATIWQEGYTVFLAEQDGDEKIRRVITKCVDLLVSDWQAANPPLPKGRDH